MTTGTHQTPRHPLHRRTSAGRHARKCNVCNHPEREAIESDYLAFRSPETIARDYGIADHSSVYRHMQATGLAARRRAPLRRVLESILEKAETVTPTGSEIIHAVYAYTQLNDAGEWVGPPGRRSGGHGGSIGPPRPNPRTRVIRTEIPADSNRQPEILESAPNA